MEQVAKYVSRSGKKDPSKELEDLEKAQFYLNHNVDELKNDAMTKNKPFCDSRDD